MSLKVFGKSVVFYSIGTITARISTFLLIPIYTHNLSIDTYGLLSILLLAIQVIGTIIDFGLLKSFMRFVPEYNKAKKTGELLGSALALNIFGGIIFFLLAYIFSPLVTKRIIPVDNHLQIFFLTLIAAFTQSLSLNLISYFRAINDAKWYTIFSIILSFLTLIGGYYFIVIVKLNLVGAIFAYIASNGIIIISILFKLSTNHKFYLKKNTLIELAKYGFPFIFARSGDLVISLVFISFLSSFVSLQEVAIYNLATKIAMIMSLVMVLPFQLALEPYVFNSINDKKLKCELSKIATFLVFSFFILSFIIIYLSPLFVKLLAPPNYEKACYIVIFILPVYLFQSFGYLSQSLLHITKKSNITGKVIFVMTFISIVFGYIFIRNFGLPGLIITVNLNQLLTSVILFYFGRKEFYITLEYKKITILMVSFVVLSSLLMLFKVENPVLFYLIGPILLIFTTIIFLKFKLFDQKERVIINRISMSIFKRVF